MDQELIAIAGLPANNALIAKTRVVDALSQRHVTSHHTVHVSSTNRTRTHCLQSHSEIQPRVAKSRGFIDRLHIDFAVKPLFICVERLGQPVQLNNAGTVALLSFRARKHFGQSIKLHIANLEYGGAILELDDQVLSAITVVLRRIKHQMVFDIAKEAGTIQQLVARVSTIEEGCKVKPLACERRCADGENDRVIRRCASSCQACPITR